MKKKGSIVQLEASKLSIKNLFCDLLNETEGFQVSDYCRSLLKKYKHNGDIDFRLVYFNSVTKIVTITYLN